MTKLELELDDKKLPFSADIYTDDDTLYIAADFGQDKTIWKQTFFAGIPDKELYKHHKDFQRIYEQLEDKLTKYTKETYPDLNIDWEMLVYDELLLMDGSFRMSVMMDE